MTCQEQWRTLTPLIFQSPPSPNTLDRLAYNGILLKVLEEGTLYMHIMPPGLLTLKNPKPHPLLPCGLGIHYWFVVFRSF